MHSSAAPSQTYTDHDSSLLNLPPSRNAPSGIAQLRKSSEQANAQHDDGQMNLDDFLVPSSIASPAGISPAPSSGVTDGTSPASAGRSAIPIKAQQRAAMDDLHISRASAPSRDYDRSTQEFGYVPRHVRKTSIDERRVCSSAVLFAQDVTDASRSLLSGEPMLRPWSRPSPASHIMWPMKLLSTATPSTPP